MYKKLTTTIEKIDDFSQENVSSSQKPSSDLTKCFTDEPDWSISRQAGYLLLQELGCGNLSVVKADSIDKSLEVFYDFYLKKSPISYINSEGKKSHSFVHFYGTKEVCEKALKQYKQALSKKHEPKLPVPTFTQNTDNYIPTIDLASPPRVDQEEEISVSDLPLELKVDLLYQTVEDIVKKVTNIEQILVNIKSSESYHCVCREKRREITQGYEKSNKLHDSELTAQFYKILISKRNSVEWRNFLRAYEIKDVTPEQSKNIKTLFLYGKLTVGSFIRALARILFGEQRIAETLLGEDGEFLKGIKSNQDRDKLFTVDEELKLIETLKIIDSDFFTNRDVYRILVREKINSYGRDLKKNLDIDKKSPSNIKKAKAVLQSTKNITSYFKRISRPGNIQERRDESSAAGPSGAQNTATTKQNIVSYESSPHSSQTD